MGLKKTAAPPEEVVDSDCSILIVAYELMKMPCALLLVEAVSSALALFSIYIFLTFTSMFT